MYWKANIFEFQKEEVKGNLVRSPMIEKIRKYILDRIC